ncbi:alanine racemase [Nocardia asteroides]|uniref:alanine racemase n=1 Tax=Nocardia asteroides TaxID=1824 RepID=UPI001E56F02D|nr:alanine racemase [Nocardia asteroides]UGT62156.1 alanine racemase [Nocardia asteroides]
MPLELPDTPFAVVDLARVDRNAARLRDRLDGLGVPLRLHVKTVKSVELVRRAHGRAPITVSTMAEAEYFADAGYDDIVYAVGIDPHKLPRVAALRARGVALTVLLDSRAQAEAVAAAGIPALIEIDADGSRAGLRPADPLLPELGAVLGDRLAGVLTHAGGSYHAFTPEARAAAAKGERDAVVGAAEVLRAAGLDCPVVSLGSTPTAHTVRDLTGVTEVRAGVYLFFDLVMAGLGICGLDDLALSVVVTVIGHRPDRAWIVTDGGWMALSRDRGTAEQPVDQGYGLVTDLAGTPLPDLLVTGASQEHGIVALRPGSGRPLPELPVGTRLRVLPNHACATAAQYARYHLLADGALTRVERHTGW